MSRLQPQELTALKKLDDLSSALSGRANTDFWSDEALAMDARWDAIRELARNVLHAFGWQAEPVEPNGAIYVGDPRREEETGPPMTWRKRVVKIEELAKKNRRGYYP